MPTLQETLIQANDNRTARQAVVRSQKELNISASSDKSSKDYHYVRVCTRRFSLVASADASDSGPLVMDINVERIGRLGNGYIPKIIILAGLDRAKEAKKNLKFVSAWVGTKALRTLDVHASDSIFVNSLQETLNEKLRLKYGTKTKDISAASYLDLPYVCNIYLYDNSCDFVSKGQKYQHKYTVDGITNQLSLIGDKMPTSSNRIDAAMSVEQSLRDKPNAAGNALGSFVGPALCVRPDFIHFGAPGSEANNPQLKLMLNVEDALDQYRTSIKNGVHKVMFTPYAPVPPHLINAARETLVAVKGDKTFPVMDFLKWQDRQCSMRASAQQKYVDGEYRTAANFAYVGDEHDISTWMHPLHSKDYVLEAMRDNELRGIPQEERQEVLDKITAAAVVMDAAGNHNSGRKTSSNPHKYRGTSEGDICAVCRRSESHPIHKVR